MKHKYQQVREGELVRVKKDGNYKDKKRYLVSVKCPFCGHITEHLTLEDDNYWFYTSLCNYCASTSKIKSIEIFSENKNLLKRRLNYISMFLMSYFARFKFYRDNRVAIIKISTKIKSTVGLLLELRKKIINFISHPKENYSNWYFLKYHILKSLYKLDSKSPIAIIRSNRKKPPGSDMFNWSLYNIYYRGEIKKVSKNYTLTLKENDYIFKGNKLIQINHKIKPLHPNYRLVYETIIQLNPISVFEIGCGNGIHLNNLQLLLPNAKLYGIDRSKEQIDFLHESYPFLKADIKVSDATIQFSQEWDSKFEITFTQAVIMHIHDGQSHLVVISNLFNMSNKYVVLMERWKNHNFMDDIKKLQEKKMIKWGKIYFYYKILEETGKPHLMICSKTPLEYPELTDYNIMPKN